MSKQLTDEALRHLQAVVAQPDLEGLPYRFVTTIGRGGMGVVFLVEDLRLNRQVAMKVIDLPAHNEIITARMQREARVIAALEHPGIVPIHEAGTLADGRFYYVMKYVRGQRLDEYLARGAALPNRLRVFQKICEAVAFAHARQVVHRDLKPENIMVGKFGEVLVMDWGLAKIIQQNEIDSSGKPTAAATEPFHRNCDPNQTDGSVIVGTPAYMAPEQAGGRNDLVDERSDVYSLGAILHFLACGVVPMRATLGAPASPPPAVSAIGSKIPKALRAVYNKAMQKVPAARYATALELAADVENFLNGLAVSSYRENLFEIAGRWLRRNKFMALLVVMYLVMRLLFYYFGRR